MPIRVTKGWNLYVDGKLNGKAAQLMIDTGAFTTSDSRAFCARDAAEDARHALYLGAINLDERGLQLAVIRRFAVGPLMVKGKEVGVMNLDGLIHGDLLKGEPPVAGLLGSEFLRAEQCHHRFRHPSAPPEIRAAGHPRLEAEKSNATPGHPCHRSEHETIVVLLPARLLSWPGECSRPGRQKTRRKKTNGYKSKGSRRAQNQRTAKWSSNFGPKSRRRPSRISRNWRAKAFTTAPPFIASSRAS